MVHDNAVEDTIDDNNEASTIGNLASSWTMIEKKVIMSEPYPMLNLPRKDLKKSLSWDDLLEKEDHPLVITQTNM